MKSFAVAAVAAALAVAASPALARDLPKGGLTLEEVAQRMRDAGYKASIEKDGDTRYIVSGTGGVNFDVYAEDCKDGRCASLQFVAGFDMNPGMSPARVSEWQRTKRWVRMRVDDEGDPFIARDVNLYPGGTEEAVEEELAIWSMMVGEFSRFIGW